MSELSIERLRDYACAFWKRSNYLDWPSVRQCSQVLKVKQEIVISLVNDDADSCLEYWNTAHKPGDEFVCVLNHPITTEFDNAYL